MAVGNIVTKALIPQNVVQSSPTPTSPGLSSSALGELCGALDCREPESNVFVSRVNMSIGLLLQIFLLKSMGYFNRNLTNIRIDLFFQWFLVPECCDLETIIFLPAYRIDTG